jgi:hypothetical protein
MLKSIAKSFKISFSKPLLLIPLIIIQIIMALILTYVIDLSRNLIDVFFSINFANANISSYLATFIVNFPFEMSILFLFFVFATFIGVFFSFLYSRIALNIAKEKSISFGKALTKTKIELKKIFLTTIFFIAILFIFLIIFDLVIAGFDGSGLFEAIAIIIAMILILVFLVFTFTVPVMAIEEIKLKDALKKAWHFIEKNFINVLVFFIILVLAQYITGFILSVIASQIIDFFINENFIFLIIVFLSLLIEAIVGIIFILAVPIFYLRKALKEELS